MSGADKVWTPLELVRWTTDYFREHGVSQARLDAELLLAHALGAKRLDLYTDFERVVSEAERSGFREHVRARAQERIPVAYLTGEREFWSRRFRVTPDVLIPRPETELLVRVASELRPSRIAEIGVGSGAVIGALGLELPDASLLGVDCSAEALAVASGNIEELGLAERVELAQGDGALGLEGPFDAVVSNPPYVSSAELEQLEPELRHEPRVALDGGSDGLDFIRRLAREVPPLLPDGHLVLEIGAGQATQVQTLLNDAGAKEVRIFEDLAGHERVIQARFATREGAC